MTEELILELLKTLGEDPNREGLKDTPRRVAAMFAELTRGYHEDPGQFATTFSAEGSQDLITVTAIPFYSLCEHHLAPFFGKVHIGYVPKDKILGLSKFARIVDVFSHRLQVQERLTQQIADALEEILSPKGMAVTVKAEHLCMSMRGVKKPNSLTHTETVRGLFLENSLLIERFYHAMNS